MEENTQQNTQQVEAYYSEKDKPSRRADDECDILCRLFPSSSSAFKAVELVSACSPQFVHVNSGENGTERDHLATTNNPSRDTDSKKSSPKAPKTPQIPVIALRMSSSVRDPRMGFVFGRTLKKSDISLPDDSMRLSAAHFRIFLNQHGLLILEDMSTNGTMVDKIMLRGTQTNLNIASTRTLDNGSIIELPAERDEEWMRFIVLIPKRDNDSAAYESKLTAYLERIQQDERRANIARQANLPTPLPLTMPFAPLQKTARAKSPRRTSIVAARGQNDYGMKWNGGNKYNVVGYIGSGAFAMVYKLSTVQHGEVYACKQIEKRRYVKNGQPGKNMHNELGIMKSISHANIVQFVESHENDRYIFIIMEFVSMGDLTAYTSDDRAMPEHMGQEVAAQIGKALHYLHAQDIVHRDVKPDNILIANHNPYVFKLSDFGLSKVVTKEDYMRTFCGTILYCAPEIYPGYKRAMAGQQFGKQGRHLDYPREETQPYKCSVDTWGIAAVLFHLLSGHPPWTGTVEDNGSVMLGTIISTDPDWEKLTLAGVSLLAIDFLSAMLQILPDKRATDEEVLAHRWIRNIVSGDIGNDDQDGHDPEQNGKTVNDTAQEDMDLPDASQLDINDKTGPRNSIDARKGADHHEVSHNDLTDSDPINQSQSDELWNYWDPGSTTIPNGMPPPTISSSQTQPPRRVAQTNTRLFGEIPESALQSSGILGQNVNKALDIEDSQMEDRAPLSESDSQNGHREEDISSLNEEEMNGLEEDMTDLEERIVNAFEQNSTSDLPEAEGDGTEDDEGHQVVNSNARQSARRSTRRSRGSAKPLAPHTRDFADVASRRSNTARSSQGHEGKRNGQRQRRPERTSGQTPPSLSHHGTESFSEYRSMDPSTPGLSGEEGKASSAHQRSKRSSQHLPPSPSHESRSKRSKVHTQPSPLSSNSASSHHPDKTRTKGSMNPPSTPPSQPNKPAQAVNPGPTLAGPSLPTDSSTPHPATSAPPNPTNHTAPQPLGHLTPTAASSIPTLATIPLTNRVTTFGRAPHLNTHPHPGNPSTPNWSRVGRNALDLTFWYPGIEAELVNSTLPTDWYANEELQCLVSTRTSRYILVNGVKLTRGNGCRNYGVLRSGDTVTVVSPDLERETVHEHERQELVFRCEFGVGVSAVPRSGDGKEGFEVLTETRSEG